MSTRCRIGLVQSDGTVKSIYCHHDGYPEGVGKMLKEHYTDRESIDKLLELGDISHLGTWYDEKRAKELWDSPLKSQQEKDEYYSMTLPYTARGEEKNIRIDKSEMEFIDNLGKCWEDYTYLWREGYDGIECWHVCETPYFKVLE